MSLPYEKRNVGHPPASRRSTCKQSTTQIMAYLLFFVSIGFILTASAVGAVAPLTMSFVRPMSNVTVFAGREAVFTCVVDDVIGAFKTAFLNVKSQTILTIDDNIITKSARVSIRHSVDPDDELGNDSDNGTRRLRKTWQLSLKEVTTADAAPYMCQSSGGISQIAHLHVLVSPDILVNQSSSDVAISEGQDVTLRCSATGYPQPNITWRREDYQPITLKANQSALVVNGSVLKLVNVHRQQMAAYLCIASNGVPPSVSKRIKLTVNFAPDVTTQRTDIRQRLGEELKISCQCHSSPPGLAYWSRGRERLAIDVSRATSYNTQISPTITETFLKFAEMRPQDQGNYSCHCSNVFGIASQIIRVVGVQVAVQQQRRMADMSVAKELSSTRPTTTSTSAPTTTSTQPPIQTTRTLTSFTSSSVTKQSSIFKPTSSYQNQQSKRSRASKLGWSFTYFSIRIIISIPIIITSLIVY